MAPMTRNDRLYLGLKWMTVAALCYAAGAVAEEKRPDPRHLKAQAAYDKAKTLYEAGEYVSAVEQGEQALTLAEAVFGGSDPFVASCLDLLGRLQRLQGRLAQAEPLHQRALAIREQAFGRNHPDVAQSLNHLAIVYYDQGLHARAEPLYERALAIREQALGKKHLDVAQSLNNLATLYLDQGLSARAGPLHERALAIREQALGKNHPSVAQSLSNLAAVYVSQGLFARAEPLNERALAILQGVLGKNHPDISHLLNNLADIYRQQGLYARARLLHQRALAIREQALDENHPDVAQSLNNLANVHADQGSLARAEALHERALAIKERALGKNHPEVARSLSDLALLRLAQHRLAEALPPFTRALSMYESRLRQEALSLSEARLTSFLQYLRAAEDRLYALLRAHPKNEEVRRLALSAVLLLKGRSVEELAATSRTIYRRLGAEDRDTFEQLRGLRSQLATLSFQGPGADALADFQQRLNELATQADALEAGLARRSAPVRAITELPSPSEIVNQVAAALPKDGALVEFIAYADRPLLAKRGMPSSKRPSQLRYLALVLLPDGGTRALDLGPAEPINRAASSLSQALTRPNAAFQARAQDLYERAFQPLLPLLGDTRRVFLSPDGQLGLVPFSALHDGRQFLIDSYDFTYLTSGRDLLPRPQDVAPSNSVVVLADPDFTAPFQAPDASSEDTPRRSEHSSSVERFFSTLRADLTDSPWTPLPGTRREAQAIQRLIPDAQVFLGPNATRQRLLQLPTPSVLHIATHGFFLEDEPASKASRAPVHFGVLSEGPSAQHLPDPLLRSGLVLAGAQPPALPPSGRAAPRPDGALVTALELAGLDLWGTQLVVLSACDTGRGDVRLGQGVYGLRRAFVVAGAETVVMSLWKVRDDTTSQLMEAYYRNLLAGQGRSSALRQAMLDLRERHPHPYFWAPFIAIGQHAPLRAPSR